MITSLRSAAIAMVAVLASFGTMFALCTRLGVDASPAVLSAALCVGLMRRPEALDARSLLSKLVALPLVAFGAGLVGSLLHAVPPLGAAIFSGGIALSILLRNYGERAREIGRTIALPLVTMLVVPVHIAGGDRVTIGLLAIAAGAIAFIASALVTWIAVRRGIFPSVEPARRPVPSTPPRDGRLPIATRMALQMLTALGLAFAIGLWLFPTHWPWIVLTAFIVCSGAAVRGIAMHRALMRLIGAIGGTLVAALVAHIPFANPPTYAATVFFVLFAGMALRPINYAYWAACATLLFALLQGAQGADLGPLFATRILCILIGALCAVAATSLVYPIRTELVVRKRVAEALAAVRDIVKDGPGHPEYTQRVAALDHHEAALQNVAPPVRLHRRLFGSRRPDEHPSTWIDRMLALLDHVRASGFDRAHAAAEMKHLGSMLRARRDVPSDQGKLGEAAGLSGSSQE